MASAALVAAATSAASQGIQLAGVSVTFKRLTGVAPSVTTTAATVTAIVRSTLPDTTEEGETGYSGNKPGGLSQDERQILVMSQDLTNAGFPLPLKKGDQALLAPTGELLAITRVDPMKRALSGTIEAYGVGVA